jgi:hypothetical protein
VSTAPGWGPAIRDMEALVARQSTKGRMTDRAFLDALALGLAKLYERVEAIEGYVGRPLDEPDAIPPIFEQNGIMRDAGVWRSDRSYHKGDLATHGGSAWVATIGSTGMKPGDGSAWRLAAKSDLSALRRAVRDEVRRALAEKTAAR